jgi:hypothetical protein
MKNFIIFWASILLLLYPTTIKSSWIEDRVDDLDDEVPPVPEAPDVPSVLKQGAGDLADDVKEGAGAAGDTADDVTSGFGDAYDASTGESGTPEFYPYETMSDVGKAPDAADDLEFDPAESVQDAADDSEFDPAESVQDAADDLEFDPAESVQDAADDDEFGPGESLEDAAEIGKAVPEIAGDAGDQVGQAAEDFPEAVNEGREKTKDSIFEDGVGDSPDGGYHGKVQKNAHDALKDPDHRCSILCADFWDCVYWEGSPCLCKVVRRCDCCQYLHDKDDGRDYC